MKNHFKIFSFALAGILFSACGTNTHYFSPSAYDKVEGKECFYSIKQTNFDFAKLSNSNPLKFINQDKKQITIQGYKNHMLLAKQGGIVVVGDDFGNISVLENTSDDDFLNYNENNSKQIYQHKFFSSIILASIKDNILALVSADNTLYAVDLNTNQIIFTHEQGTSLGQISKLANPIFLQNFIIYPTLDAKIVFFDLNSKKITQNVPVGYEQFFNNILLVKNINSSLVIVSTTKILSLYENNLKNIDINAKNALVKDDYIYVVTDDARLIKFDLMLQEISSVKFEFARINDMIFVDEDLYLLENNGYMIHTNTNLNNIKISKIKNYKQDKSYATTSGFYFGRYFLEFK